MITLYPQKYVQYLNMYYVQPHTPHVRGIECLFPDPEPASVPYGEFSCFSLIKPSPAGWRASLPLSLNASYTRFIIAHVLTSHQGQVQGRAHLPLSASVPTAGVSGKPGLSTGSVPLFPALHTALPSPHVLGG